jgi:DNA-binding NtrC family response regulator
MKRHLLVVDDESSNRDAISRHFRLMGYEVETAVDGRDALERMADYPFRVVVSDILMPRMDGIALLQALRRDYPTTRTVMITGYVTLENGLACVKYGAETCVFKPFQDLRELDGAVESAFAYHERWERKLLELRGLKGRSA